MSDKTEELRIIRIAMRDELDHLPHFSVFGDDNASDIADMHEWIDDIGRVLKGKKPNTEAVTSYIEGSDGWFLGDYLDD